jgi:hypothetical protein
MNTRQLIDLPAERIQSGSFSPIDALMNGAILLIRGIDNIVHGRESLVTTAAAVGSGDQIVDELIAFYEDATLPSISTIHALSLAVKTFRTRREWSRILHDLFVAMNLPLPVLYDNGISRLILPPEILLEAKASGIFEKLDFQRESPAGLTETFMPNPANIHRDYNRKHYLFQFNIWFPLHDTEEDEVVRIFPQWYRQPVFDIDNAPEMISKLGNPASFQLSLGDAVVFHGEHLHTSPIEKPGWRRQSVDFRVAVACPDDNRHYRHGYLNAANFEEANGLGPAVDFILELEDPIEPSAERLLEILDIFDCLPFAEDRYLFVVDKAPGKDMSIAIRALTAVIERSKLFFWVLNAGIKAEQMGNLVLAQKSASKTLRLIERDPTLPNFMVIDYQNASTQLNPSTAHEIANTILAIRR